MVMWTNTHCFDFFHVILYYLNIHLYVQNYRPSASPSIILINLFKVAIMWERLLIITCASTQ